MMVLVWAALLWLVMPVADGFKSDGETCKPGSATGYEGCIKISGRSVSGIVHRYVTEKEKDCGDFRQDLITYNRLGNPTKDGQQLRTGCIAPSDRWSATFTGIDPKRKESSYSDPAEKPYYSRMCVTAYKKSESSGDYVPITNLTCRDVTE